MKRSLPPSNLATLSLINRLIEVVERDELDVSSSYLWVEGYDFTPNKEHRESPSLGLKNDKAIRALIDYMKAEGILVDVKLIEHPYAPNNVELKKPYPKFVEWLGARVGSMAKLRQLKGALVEPPKADRRIQYDPDSGAMSYGGRVAIFKEGANQRLLLDLLFRDKRVGRRTWSQDEIREKLDPANPSSYKVQWPYNTAQNTNRKLRTELGIHDLLMVSRVSVKVNLKYLV